MEQIIRFPTASEQKPKTGGLDRGDDPAVRTDAVYVIFTTIEETPAAVAVGQALADALAAPLTLMQFRAIPYQLSLDDPNALSPVETDAIAEDLRSKGFNLSVRVTRCRDERRTIPMAFRARSLIVIAGERRWWPTKPERWRRMLEGAGHFVVFVDPSEHKDKADA